MEDLDTRDPPLNDRLSRRALRALAIVLAFVAVAVGELASQAPPAASLTMLSKDGRRTIPLSLVNGQEYVGLDDLTPIFQLTVHDDALGALTVSHKGRTIILTADQTLVSVAGRLISLPAPATRAGRRWLVPVEFINRALAPIYDTALDLRKTSHLLIVGDLRVPRVTVRYDLVAPGGRVTIDATPRATSTVTQENNRLTIRFDADALDIANPPLAPLPAQGLVQGVRLVDPTTLSVDVGRVASFRAMSQPIDTTTRLTIDITAPPAETTSPAPAALPAPSAAPPAPADVDVPALTSQVPAIRTVAIDPGHGGSDTGVRTPDGVREKDLTLAVARRVKAAIEGRLGIRVLLTRDDDRDLPLDDRAAVANNNKADLFISLHANASLRPAASGATIYYAAADPEQPAPAAPPARVPTFGGGARAIELVAWDQAQTRHIDQSAAFAAILERAFHDRVPLGPHSIERAPLGVLASANMPAVLVEMGLLTNPAQARRLADVEFQNALVQAITEAVITFRDSLEGTAR
jgi:N-acetylmuramoyl-L-alanine amidase